MSVSNQRSQREPHSRLLPSCVTRLNRAPHPAIPPTPLHHPGSSAQASWASPPTSTNDLASFFIDKNRSHHHAELTPLLATRSPRLSAVVLKVTEESFSSLRQTPDPTSCILPDPDPDPSLTSSMKSLTFLVYLTPFKS